MANATPPVTRLASVDIYRGFVMFLMVAEVLELARLAKEFPGNWFWQWVTFHTTHVEWAGCSLHDLIQPSFSFLVGVAVPFSIAARRVRGDSFGQMALHALLRSIILILLGVFLRSNRASMTNWTFEDTLSQIGLGYFFLFLLGWTRQSIAWLIFVLILVAYWAAWAMYPNMGTEFVDHWKKNQNIGWVFDTWFLNLFPRPKPFTANGGGYLTLSFIPTLATMILGLIAGWWLRMDRPMKTKLLWMVLAGFLGIGMALVLHDRGICPNVKKIWTPTWVLYSGGWCFLLLALFVWLVEVIGIRRPFFVFLVFGMNSIAIYCLTGLTKNFIKRTLTTHLGSDSFKWFGIYEHFAMGLCVMTVLWLVLYWMYRRKLFLKI
jgi:heparan-alpha-glucosaminide N-acetyltransferase